MIIDEAEFLGVARIVCKANKYEHNTDPADLVESMKSAAYRELYSAQYFATRGFVLSAFTGSDKERHVKASVAYHILEDVL
jgi:hypothetical protein